MRATFFFLLALCCAGAVNAQQQDQSQPTKPDQNPPAEAQPAPKAEAPPAPPAPQQSAQQQPPKAFVDESILVGTSARASKVIGAKLYRGANSVGDIKDVLVDLEHATVPAVIVSISGLLGMNEKLVAVPAAMIKVGKEAHFTIDLTEEQLKAAPAFDPNKL